MLEFRRADDSDRDKVVALVSQMWGSDISARYDWLYRANPHGRALSWLGLDNETGEALAVTSVFPRKHLVDGQPRMGAIRGDVFVHPSLRRQGVGGALQRLSLREMHELGVDFSYGTTPQRNMNVFISAGAKGIAAFHHWFRPLASKSPAQAAWRPRTRVAARLLRFSQRARPLVRVADALTHANTRGLTALPVDRFGPEFDTLFERAAVGYRVIGVRDHAYLNWRYFDPPHARQTPFALRRGAELVGLLVLEFAASRARLVDLFIRPERAQLRAGMQLALDLSANQGCTSLEVWCSAGSPISRILPWHAFIPVQATPFATGTSPDDPQAATLLDPGAWHFTLGDHDADALISP